VIRAAYAEYAESRPSDRWDRYLAHAADVWSRLDQAQLLVAEVDGRVVGTITLYTPGSPAEAQGWPSSWAGLRLLGVQPGARGVGIGRALVEASIRRARALGASAVALHTTEMMAVARALYERMGFERIVEYDFHARSGTHALAYRLDLTGSQQGQQ
jgi:predicted N-acetyltransferase YhbS